MGETFSPFRLQRCVGTLNPDHEVPAVIVGVVPDVTGLDRVFDYVVPADLVDRVDIGTRVRVVLNGRRIAGWVVRFGPEDGSPVVSLRPIEKVSGIGPDADIVSLCSWASERWCAQRLRPFFVTASSPTMVSRPAPRFRTSVRAEPSSPAATDLLQRGGGVLRLPPSDDQMPAILSAARLGSALVVVGGVDHARVLAARLRRTGLTVALMPDDWAAARGGVDVVIGSRATAFAPCPDLCAVVVIDEHEESLQEERAPTWHARDVVAERARRAGVPLLLISPCPTLDATYSRTVVAPPREREHNSWPTVVIADPGDEPPWKRSLLSSDLIAALRNPAQRVACVLNVKGQARLLACRSCRALVCCEVCGGSLGEDQDGQLSCRVCLTTRSRLCAVCGSTTLTRVRPGVARLQEELQAAAQRDVLAVVAGGGQSVDDTAGDVFVGTEALLHRVRRIDVVAFLDFDAELLAPRFRAGEQAFALLARAARLVGTRRGGGQVVLQTTLTDHPVVQAAVQGDPSIVSDYEMQRRESLGLPPFSALAIVEGAGAEQFVTALGGTSVTVAQYRDKWLIRATDHTVLSSACAAVERIPGAKIRIEVDPPRL